MNAGVVGEFGVEGRGENVALSQTDHTPINLGLDRGVRPDIGDERPTDEHERKVLDVTEIGRGDERTELPTVSVAANRGVRSEFKREESHVAGDMGNCDLWII